MKDFIPVFVVVGIIFGIVYFANYLEYSQCANNVSEMKREFRYDWNNGCRIKLDDGTYIYWKMYRNISTE